MSDTTRDQQLLMLGEIKGLVESLKTGQNQTMERLDRMDDRLRKVEQRAAVNGAVSGGIMGVGMALIVETARNWMRSTGKGG